MSVYPIRPSFAAGELAPSLHKRVDLNQYYLGLKTAENVFVMPQGGLINRPGFEYVADTYNENSVLVPFVFSETDALVLEFRYDQKIRFYENNGTPLYKNGAIYEINGGLDVGIVADSTITQSGDTLFIFSDRMPPKKIVRYGQYDWRVENFDMRNGPFMPMNTTDMTVSISSYNGSSGKVGEQVRVTASDEAVWDYCYPGDLLRVEYTRPNSMLVRTTIDAGTGQYTGTPYAIDGKFYAYYQYPDYETQSGQQPYTLQYSIDGGYNWVDYEELRLLDNAWHLIEGELYSEDMGGITPLLRIRSEWTEEHAKLKFQLFQARYDTYGILQLSFQSALDDKVYICNVLKKTDCLNIPIKTWALGAFGFRKGYPRSCGFGAGRFWVAYSKLAPQGLWGSVTQDYDNFGTDIPLMDDDAVSAYLDSSRMDAIRHIVTMDNIVVFTEGSVWNITAGSEGVITPSSIMAKFQEAKGASKVQPVPIGNSILFCTNKGNELRELAFDLGRDAFVSINRSILSQHLFDGHKIIKMAYQPNPFGILWCLRDDGILLTFTYLPEHDVYAWTKQIMGGGGIVKDICVIPGEFGDDVWAVVVRKGAGVGGNDMATIERMQNRYFVYDDYRHETGIIEDDQKYWPFLDCHSATWSRAFNWFNGWAHLEGQRVMVAKNGENIGETTIIVDEYGWGEPNYVIEAEYGDELIIGFPYQSNVETLGIEVQTSSGTVTTRPKLIDTVWISTKDTRGIKVGPNADRLTRVPECRENLFTGDARVLMDSGWDQNGHIYIRQSDPYPMTILAITPQFDLGRPD